MPIIEPVHDQNAPLSQGDILKGVCLFSTKRSWTDCGGEPEGTNRALGLVLSRPCVAAHDEWVLVAAVEKYKNKPPAEFESYDEAKQFTVQVPKEGTSERQAFLASARIALLSKEFAHDLHLRIFRAFASLGFDDHPLVFERRPACSRCCCG
jgi:hypothetical protein